MEQNHNALLALQIPIHCATSITCELQHHLVYASSSHLLMISLTVIIAS